MGHIRVPERTSDLVGVEIDRVLVPVDHMDLRHSFRVSTRRMYMETTYVHDQLNPFFNSREH
jgi:hypothetical protein